MDSSCIQCLHVSLDGNICDFQALRAHNQELEEAQIKASSRLSNHKQATQLLQTELQDSRAQVEEKEKTIQTLKSKLRESEVWSCLFFSTRQTGLLTYSYHLPWAAFLTDICLPLCQKNASPSVAELEELRTKLFKMEVELSSASDKHQQE